MTKSNIISNAFNFLVSINEVLIKSGIGTIVDVEYEDYNNMLYIAFIALHKDNKNLIPGLLICYPNGDYLPIICSDKTIADYIEEHKAIGFIKGVINKIEIDELLNKHEKVVEKIMKEHGHEKVKEVDTNLN